MNNQATKIPTNHFAYYEHPDCILALGVILRKHSPLPRDIRREIMKSFIRVAHLRDLQNNRLPLNQINVCRGAIDVSLLTADRLFMRASFTATQIHIEFTTTYGTRIRSRPRIGFRPVDTAIYLMTRKGIRSSRDAIDITLVSKYHEYPYLCITQSVKPKEMIIREVQFKDQ